MEQKKEVIVMEINAGSLVAVHTHTHIWFISENKKNEYIEIRHIRLSFGLGLYVFLFCFLMGDV